jgi:hypothetical protein
LQYFSHTGPGYTHIKKNSVKLWICVSLNIIAIIVTVIAGLVFISITTEGHPEYNEYLRGFNTFLHSNSADIPESSYRKFSTILLTLGIISVLETGIWVWALMYNAIKNKDFYNDYSTIR